MRNLVDISLSLDADYRHQTPEGVKNVQLEFELIKDYPGGQGQQVRAVRMRLHHGTHVDAPMHFVPGGATLEKIPLETFYGEAMVLDLTAIGQNEPIEPAQVEAALGGRDLNGARVLLRTDWNAHHGEPGYFEASPYISPKAVDWICARKPLLVGYDYSHPKDAPDTPAPVYAVRTFLENEIVPMGYLRNLDQVDPGRPMILSAFPLAFSGVEASPVRAVLIQD
ncbi:MAG TPA: cyclase family protein [Trebonia sp.]|nr:cyclase family protein [Trebonia sp.]